MDAIGAEGVSAFKQFDLHVLRLRNRGFPLVFSVAEAVPHEGGGVC
jgi:hypothetical protein